METNEKYENILELEFEAQGAQASVELMPGNTPLYRRGQIFEAHKRARKALYDAIDTLSQEEMKEYGDYRTKRREEYAKRAR